MSIAEDLVTIAENMEEVHKSGYMKGESDFWDGVQNYGNRTSYASCFANWGVKYLSPKYKVVPTGNANGLFNGCKQLEEINGTMFDLSQSSYNPTGTSSTTYIICQYCEKLKVFPDIGLQAGYYAYAFSDCKSLETIEVLRVDANCTFTNTFRNCNSLQNIVQIEGEFGENISFEKSVALTTETIVRIIEHLSASVTGQTLTLNVTAKNNMVFPYTSPETNITYNSWDDLIETKTNWNISI